jgi:hypothetical protein
MWSVFVLLKYFEFYLCNLQMFIGPLVVRLGVQLYKICSIELHVLISVQGEQRVGVHLSELGWQVKV